MYKIKDHPILEVPQTEEVCFVFKGQQIKAEKGFTIAAALHQSGFPVHSHSLKDRNRSLECGIGKCGACEMLVDGEMKRICITKVDNVKEIREIPRDYTPEQVVVNKDKAVNVYKTTVAIIGAGPAGLAVREELNKNNIDNIVIDNNDKIGGQFLMQTHQFFFFEKEKNLGECVGLILPKPWPVMTTRVFFSTPPFGISSMGKGLLLKTLAPTIFILWIRNPGGCNRGSSLHANL
ncbi:MAG: 2Fe-2S iron-sulfur cluster-binding protein [Bacteroidales bacterium]